MLEKLIMPKEEALFWYCDIISHPNIAFNQRIGFNYQKFGAFNYYQEYTQPLTAFAEEQAFNRVGIPDFTVYKDILLTSIEAVDIVSVTDRLELNYKTLYHTTGAAGIKPQTKAVIIC